jgi:amino acid transporter
MIQSNASSSMSVSYKSDLKKGIDGLMSFSFGLIRVNTILSISVMVSYGLSTGGPATMMIGWIVSFVMTMLVGFSLAEICGAYPTCGSVYHWTGQMASHRWRPVLSYWAGLLNW